MIEYIDTTCKSLINRMEESLFTLRTYSIRLSANLYSGCAFNCPYCYAPFIHRFNPNATPQQFGSKIFIKKNALEIVQNQVSRMKKRKDFRYEYVDLGTVTDCYQPVERTNELTRNTVQILANHGMPVTILTKSDLVTRDTDILQKLAEQKKAVVGITLTIASKYEKQYKSFLEPKSPSTSRRLKAIKYLRSAGIPTFVFINPVVPFLTAGEDNIKELVKEISETGNTDVFFGVMKLNPLTWQLFRDKLQRYDSSLVSQFNMLYKECGEKEFGRSMVPSMQYREELYQYACDVLKEQGMGFSCEGGHYHLWLNDWADCEKGFNYPTGYNFWRVLKDLSPAAVSFEQLKKYVVGNYTTITDKYLKSLEEFWNNGSLYSELQDIKMITKENGQVMYMQQ